MDSVVAQLSGDARDSEVNNSLEVAMETNIRSTITSKRCEMQSNEELYNSEGRKRSRPVDDEEIWNEVGRKGKVLVRSITHSGSERIPEEQIEVSMISRKEKLPKQIGLARILKNENIVDVLQIKYVNAYKILFKFHKEESADRLIRCKFFIEKEYRCQKTFEVGVSYGIIKDIDLELSEEDLRQDLNSETPIIGIKRLQKRKKDFEGFEDSESVRLCFKGPTLPSYVYTYGTRVKVEPYVFSVTQCSNCWRFGHNHKTCSNKTTCPKCGKYHPNCENTIYKCVNCSGQHMALAKQCPVYVKERKVREVMAVNNCTYKKALTLYVPPVSQHTRPLNKPAGINPIVHEFIEQSDCSEPLDRASTYAAAVQNEHTTSPKSTILAPRPAKKNRKRRKSIRLVEESSSEYDSDKLHEQKNTEDMHKNGEFKKFDVAQLIQKVKDVVFMKKISFEEKIKSCGKLLFDWLISSIVDCLSDWPVLKSFIQND